MAQLDKNGKLFGTLGELALRRVDGKIIVQTKPGRKNVNQSHATKQAATDFGRASRLTSKLAWTLKQTYWGYHDATMHNRLRKKVYQAMRNDLESKKGEKFLYLGTPEDLSNFEFNQLSPFTDNWNGQIDIEFDLQVKKVNISCSIAKARQLIRWPKTNDKAKLHFAIHSFNEKSDTLKDSQYSQLVIDPFNSSVQQLQFTSTILPEGCLIFISGCLVFETLSYPGQEKIYNHKNFHPAKIFKVFKSPMI